VSSAPMFAPPAPASPPPQLSPGGRTAIRVTIVAAASIVMVGVVAALGVTSWGLSTFRVSADTQTLPMSMRSVVIDTADVPIAIRIIADRNATEPRANLRLVNSTQAGEHRLVVTEDPAGTRVSIEGRSSSILGWARGGEITLTLPPDQARRLTVRTEQDAGVVMAQADLDQLIARTDNGAVILSGGARRIEVHTVNGDVSSRHPLAVTEEFAATTANGDITVDFRDAAPRVVEATSRDGDVAIGLPGRGPFLVHAQSGQSSRVRVPETSDPGSAVAEVSARSDNGDVVVAGQRPGHR
jgi:putative adhesin